MKILIGQIAHETNTFSNVKTTVESFQSWEWLKGDEILKNHRNVRSYLGGLIDRAEELGIEIAPSFSAFAMPSGIITKETNERLKFELLSAIKNAGDFDAVCLALHGAGVAEDTDDLEGDILEAVRALIGNKIPIAVTLDLHANLTQKMVNEADALLGVNFYPHTDSYERGIEAVDLTLDILSGKLQPVMSLQTLPVIIPTSTTNLSPSQDVNLLCWEKEKDEDIIDCTFFHGFPYTDIPEVGVSVLTITNNQPGLAIKTSQDISKAIWEKREEFFPTIDSPKEGIQRALSIDGFPIVMNETSDNPGGGTPGDGTYLLRAMIEEKVKNACFSFICDPEVVNIAHQAGVGAVINVNLGGKTDNLHGEPIAIKGYVKSLTDGKFIQSSPMGKGSRIDYGKSCRLQVDGIDIVVCSKKSQTFDEQIFLLHGIDVRQYKIVALKSSQHFRAGFEPLAKAIISVDSPGLSSFSLSSFNHTRLSKRMYPFQKDLSYEELEIEEVKK